MVSYEGNPVDRDLYVDGASLARQIVTHDSALKTILALVEADRDFGEAIGVDKYTEVDAAFAAGIIKLVRRINSNEESAENFPRIMRGVGGHVTLCFLQAYLGRYVDREGKLVLENGVVIPVNSKFSVRITGKIREYCFKPHNPYGDVGNAHLVVDVTHQTFQEMRAPKDPPPFRTEEYRWTIQLCNARVLQRSEGAYYHEFPFPSLQGNPDVSPGGDRMPTSPVKVIFPAEATNPSNNNGIWKRGLDHKIYAEGPDQIIVKEITRSDNGGTPSPLPDTHPWYEVTLESCVDLMFKDYPPSSELPEQREYCLGRCAHPVIVNSGGD